MRRALPILCFALSLATCRAGVLTSETGAAVTGTAGAGGTPSDAGPGTGGDAAAPDACQACAEAGCCLFSGRAGSGTSVEGRSIDADPATGDLVVSGWYADSVDLGTGPLPSAPQYGGAALVARYDAAGHLRWAKGFPGATVSWIAFQEQDVLVAGSIDIAVDFGCGTLQGGGTPDGLTSAPVFLKLDGKTGSCVWSVSPGPGLGAWSTGAIDPAGDILLVGDVGPVDVPMTYPCEGGAAVTGTGFVTKRSGADGSCLWIHGLPTYPAGVAVDASSAAYVATSIEGSSFVFAGQTYGGPTGRFALLLEYDGAGNEVWAQSWISDAGFAAADGVAVTPDQRVWVESAVDGTITLGAQTLGAAMAETAVVAGFTPDGELIAATGITADYGDYGPILASDPAGALVITGSFYGAVSIGDHSFDAGSTGASFIAKLDPASALAPAWARFYDIGKFGPLLDGLRAATCDDILVTGAFEAPLDLGCGTLALDGPSNLFFARLGP